MVTVNGEPKEAAGRNLKEFLIAEGYELARVVVEYNLDIIPRDNLDEIVIADEANIEVLRFVGGG